MLFEYLFPYILYTQNISQMHKNHDKRRYLACFEVIIDQNYQSFRKDFILLDNIQSFKHITSYNCKKTLKIWIKVMSLLHMLKTMIVLYFFLLWYNIMWNSEKCFIFMRATILTRIRKSLLTKILTVELQETWFL